MTARCIPGRLFRQPAARSSAGRLKGVGVTHTENIPRKGSGSVAKTARPLLILAFGAIILYAPAFSPDA